MFFFVLVLFSLATSCFIEQSSIHYKEFEHIKDQKVDNSSFIEVFPNRRRCEIVRAGYSNVIRNFTCSIDYCMKWCIADSNCLGILYGNNTCIRSYYFEIFDTEFKEEFPYRSFYKGGEIMMPVKGNLCYWRSPKKICEWNKKCMWNRGRIPMNDELQGSSWNGYCARKKC